MENLTGKDSSYTASGLPKRNSTSEKTDENQSTVAPEAILPTNSLVPGRTIVLSGTAGACQ